MFNNNTILKMNKTTLVSAFLQNAELFPQQDAAREGKERITYAELDVISNGIAARLQHAYPATSTPHIKIVGVLLPRSIANVACWLGAAKAGIAYAPIGLQWPQNRIQKILNRCNITTILTSKEYIANLPSNLSIEILNVADFFTHSFKDSPTTLCTEASCHEENLPLYVIHTSGSTGEPKSVCLTHGNTYAVLQDSSEYGVQKHDYMMHVIATTFDLSMMEVWGSLLHAGTIIITETHVSLDAELLKSHISHYNIDWAILSTGVFNILSTQNPATLKEMRDVCICGEMPNREAIVKVRTACPSTTIHNCYGPAECTIYVTRESITSKSLESSIVPAGQSIAAAKIFIVDEEMRPLPANSEGEVLISGSCVGLGYINDAERTNHAFVHKPYSTSLVYRTGDYGSMDEHGILTILGRKDNQIKIDGHRIELGEVCSMAMKAPDVKMAFISFTQGIHKELVAYIIPKSSNTLQDKNLCATFIADLKDYMFAFLPAYMIPSHYILIDTLPLNAHGKVNQDHLPKVMTQAITHGGSILEMFQEVLGNYDYGVNDAFLAAGGTSIKAARLIGNIRLATQVPVPFSLLLEEQTVAKVQAHIERAKCTQDITASTDIPSEPVSFHFHKKSRHASSTK